MTPTEDTPTTFSDGCTGGEHSPASNVDCEMGPARPRGRLRSIDLGRGNTTHAVHRPFDAAAVAAEAVERGEDPLSAVVGQYGGYLSACWDNLAGAGVFESERAAAAAASVEAWLRGREPREVHVHNEQRAVVEMEPGDRLLLLSPSGDLDAEHAARIRDEVTATVRAQGGRPVSIMAGFYAIVLKKGLSL